MMCHEKLREVDAVSVRSPHILKTKQTALSSSNNELIMSTAKLQKTEQKSSNVSVDYNCKSHVSSNTENSRALGKDVVYMNTKSQQI